MPSASAPATPNRNFYLQLEDDPAPPDVPRARGILHKRRPPVREPTEMHFATEAETSDSFLAANLSTIQPLGNGKALLILVVTCHPAPERRFENATVTWGIYAPSRSASPSTPPRSSSNDRKLTVNFSGPEPKISSIAPQQSIGGWTEEQTKLIWGVKAPVVLGTHGASVGVQPSVEHDSQKSVMHAMTILGSIRGNGSRAIWTIEENKSSQQGIPTHFQFAMVVDYQGPFVMELDVKALVSGGLWDSYVHATRDRNTLSRIIDVQTWKCGEVTWKPDEAGWKNFMAEMTGEVKGVVVEFEQKIARP